MKVYLNIVNRHYFVSEIQTCHSKHLGHFKMKKMSKYPSKLLSSTLKSFHYDILTEPRWGCMKQIMPLLVIHYFPLISDTTKDKQLPYASLAYTQAHMYMHAHVHTHKHTHTHTHTLRALSTFSCQHRVCTGSRADEWKKIWREVQGGGGCFGIKLSVVGLTGDETTGEVRQLTVWDSRSLNGSLAVLNRPVSVTEDERVTERVLRIVSLISILNPLSVFHFIWTWRRVKFKSTKGWVTDFKLQRDDRS